MANKKPRNKIKIGISIGDPNGIGVEVIIKSLLDNRMLDFCTPILYGSTKVTSFHRKVLGISDFSFNKIKSADESNTKRANIIESGIEEFHVDLGKSSTEAGKYAFKSLENAVKDLASNKIDVLVTAPINKKNIQSTAFNFPGHTEYLANYSNEENFLMLLVHNNLRVGTVTGHIPLHEVSKNLSEESIIQKLRVLNKSLKIDFGIQQPKIAVLGLNPHSGDNGLIGDEEQTIIIPALEKAKSEKIVAFGPFPSDAFFGGNNVSSYDAVLAMYHDQGLIPFKTLAFDDGVNYTAGLPIVRTSPDHGVAYDIAGKGLASENSFRSALYLACDIYNKRKESKQLLEGSLISKDSINAF